MTLVPLPDTPCVRVRFLMTDSDGTELGNRIFLAYSGATPSASDLNTLATTISDAYAAHLAALTTPQITLNGVVVEDLASYAGATGTDNTAVVGSRSGVFPPNQIAFNLAYQISRRYRGGKPKGYWAFGSTDDFYTSRQWKAALVASVEAGFAAFIAAIVGSTFGASTVANHVNLSYKHGFTNIANSSGRERAVPTYRATATHDAVTGYIGKALFGSQRRRRSSTSA
jgi:hypothetical protein